MEFPIRVELDITQDDFICCEILEEAADIPYAKKSAKVSFLRESGVLALCALAVFVFRDNIAFEAIYFVIGFEVLFFLNFAYNYFYGIDHNFKLAVTHLLTARKDHTFFTPEKGIAFFYRDRGEYLTNEQRRYFDYSLVDHIKITRHLFIFIMKKSDEKGLRGFVWMVLPKRNMTRQQERDFTKLCRQIEEKYHLTPWTDCRIFD